MNKDAEAPANEVGTPAESLPGDSEGEDTAASNASGGVVTRLMTVESALERGEPLSAVMLQSLLDSGYHPGDIGRVLKELGVDIQSIVRVINTSQIAIDVRGALVTAFVESSPSDTGGWLETMPSFGHCPRPEVWAGQGDVTVLARQAWGVIRRANDPVQFFNFSGSVAWVRTAEDDRPKVEILRRGEVQYFLNRLCAFYRISQSGDQVPCGPPASLVGDLLAEPDPPLPRLDRVITAPAFARDGTLHDRPGYNPATRAIYVRDRALKVPPVLQHPPRAEVDRALPILKTEVLGDFPFVGESDLAHALAAMLLPFARSMIDGVTPLHLLHKSTPGTGATLLSEALTHPALGSSPPTLTEGSNDEEWRKRITARLLEGPAVVVLDNLGRRLDSPALASALTTVVWEDRKLGVSQIVGAPVRCLWLATGNNVQLSNEMSRRTVSIRLDAGVERPWLERTGYRHDDLMAWVRENRGQIIWAIATLVNAWIDAGMPRGDNRLGMYESWSDVIGGILKVAGVPGFLANLDDLYESADAEGDEWRRFVGEWWRVFGDRKVKVRDLYGIAEEILDLGTSNNDRSRQTRLGKQLVMRRDRIFDGLQIKLVGVYQGAQVYALIDKSQSERSGEHGEHREAA